MPRLRVAAVCLALLAPSLAGAAQPWLSAFGRDQGETKIEVEFTGVDGALLENVRALSSLHRLAGSKDIDAEVVGRLVQRAPSEAATALKPFGYYEPRVSAEYRQAGDGWRATVRIEPGTPVRLIEQQVAVTGPGRDEPFMRAALARSTLRTGQQLSHPAYDRLKGDLLRTALSRGYLDASFTESELIVDPATHGARALLSLETGERYRFGPTTIEQNTLRPGLVRRYLRYEEGGWYDAEALLRTQFALDDSQYFSLVEVLPEARDRNNRIAPVRITAEPNRRHVYTIGLGYGTDTGPRGTIGWEDRRVNPSGHRMRSELRASDLDTSASLTYVIPWTDPALEKLSYGLRVFNEQKADVETEGATLKAALTQVRGNWQRVLSVALDRTEDRIASVAGGTPVVTRDRSTLLVPGISYARLPPDFLGVNAVPRGFQAELLGSTTSFGSDTNFLRFTVQDDRTFRFADKWAVRLRARVGASAVGDFEELPAPYRFFTGGDNSVRGYDYNELSPLDANGNRIGGRHLLVGSVELQRSLPRNLVGAVFVDAGNAFDKFGDPLEYSAGVGLRYRLPFLSIGIDVAQSLSDTSRNPRFHINFTPEF